MRRARCASFYSSRTRREQRNSLCRSALAAEKIIHRFRRLPTVFLNGDVAKKVAELKQGEGPDLHIWGSGNLLQTLMKHDLVDNFWLMIYPITLGEGKRLFAGARSRPRSR